jgi:hypothetical protein
LFCCMPTFILFDSVHLFVGIGIGTFYCVVLLHFLKHF